MKEREIFLPLWLLFAANDNDGLLITGPRISYLSIKYRYQIRVKAEQQNSSDKNSFIKEKKVCI